MAITKTVKTGIYNKLETEATNQKAILLFTTRDSKETLDSALNFEFRSSARKNGVIVQIAKNTLINKAFPGIPEKLKGQTYIAFLKDVVETSSEVEVPKIIVGQIDDKFKKNFDIVGSIVKGEFYDKEKTISLSKVPSFDVSMAMVAGSINQITTKIARIINEIPSSVVRGVKAAKAE